MGVLLPCILFAPQSRLYPHPPPSLSRRKPTNAGKFRTIAAIERGLLVGLGFHDDCVGQWGRSHPAVGLGHRDPPGFARRHDWTPRRGDLGCPEAGEERFHRSSVFFLVGVGVFPGRMGASTSTERVGCLRELPLLGVTFWCLTPPKKQFNCCTVLLDVQYSRFVFYYIVVLILNSVE